MTHKPLDFHKVEALRKHMMLTSSDMAKVLGVSRVTYYGWLRGKAVRRKNEEEAKKSVRKLLVIMTDHSWPSPEIVALDQKQRSERLFALIGQY
jgi:hypothetical protein